MTEASGKKNRMFASNNTLKQSTWLILISVLAWVLPLQAQQTQEAAQNPEASENRRIERLSEGSTPEWEMDLSLFSTATEAPSDPAVLVLPDADQNQKLQRLLSNLAADPSNSKFLSQLNSLLTDVLGQAGSLMDTGSLDEAETILALIKSIDPNLPGLDTATSRFLSLKEANELLVAGYAALESHRVLEPENSSALFYFNQALAKDPENQSAKSGLARVQDTLLERALESARELDFETAENWLLEASATREDQQPVEDVRVELATFKQERAVELEQRALSAMNSGNFDMADFTIIDLIALGGQDGWVKSLRGKLKKARTYGGYVPGQIIKDELLQAGGFAPDLVVISAGSFLMGSPGHADDDHGNEIPQHRVRFEFGFALGVKEVSVEEFRLFITSSGYRTAAQRSGKSKVYNESAGRLNDRDGTDWRHDYQGKKAKPDMPVLHVSFEDAVAYVQWLARETGKRYRLPSEAEYEYVARAGGSSTYWWGEGSPPEAVENLTGERDHSPRKREWTTSFKKYGDGHWGPAPIGSFANAELKHPMGVYDIAGNVSEWTQDCWHHNYIKAPVDGSAWVNPGCNRRVGRGGYWASGPEQSRATFRMPVNAAAYGPVVGIRIARDL